MLQSVARRPRSGPGALRAMLARMVAKTDYERLAPDYDRRYETNRYGGIDDALRAFAHAGQPLLEVGCGTGHWLAQLEATGCDPVGLEPSGAMLARARARGLRAGLVQDSAEALPFPDASFDRVACINAIHHFEDIPPPWAGRWWITACRSNGSRAAWRCAAGLVSGDARDPHGRVVALDHVGGAR
jgi:SAM-dependent methyltransferase